MIIGKGAGVILISENGSVLLQHRDKRNKWNQDSWSEFGGQIEEGEKPEETAKRELKEELGIKVKSLKFFKKYDINRSDGAIYIQFVFTAFINQSIQALKKQQKEGDDLAFFTAEEIENLKTADYTKKILKDYFCL
jgi:mutator protein MutT